MTIKRPIRQWVVDSDDPCIARTPEEAQLYFKRRREVRRKQWAERWPYIQAQLEMESLLNRKGHLDS